MKRTSSLALVLLFLVSPALAQNDRKPGLDDFYKLGPDSLPQEGVPKGTISEPHVLPCKIFPGTQHTYWVYVPAQYDPAVPASLMIFQDGQAFKDAEGSIRAQNVLDNLIHRREIPVMIAVFINPGRTPEQPEPTPRDWGDRATNRPTEYNSLDDRYARVIIDELLPVLYEKYNISKDPRHHGIGGASSGAIAAFTVAWERPDQFHKVLSIVGSFTNIRGGHVYPDKVRGSEKKPIRVFFQDGRNDNRGQRRGGKYDESWDWFKQNVRLVEAMTEKGYDINYSWGIGLHGTRQGGAMMPEMMRWLWRDHGAATDPDDEVERSFNVLKERLDDKQAAAAKGAAVVNFYGYDDCIRLENATTRVTLCPRAGGRVLEYTLNGTNALYLPAGHEGWEDKEDGTQGSMDAGRFDIGPELTIPAHPNLWQGRWQGEIIGDRTARLTSQPDTNTGVQLIREFKLDEKTSRLDCRQTIKNISDSSKEYCHWSRTFAHGGGICVIPLTEKSLFPNGYVMYEHGSLINARPEDPKILNKDGYLVITGAPRKPKLGMDTSAGWFAYLMKNDLMFVKKFPVDRDRAYNEVAGLTMSIWYPDAPMCELEPIGPREKVAPGQSASFTETWYLLPQKFPEGDGVKPGDVAETVKREIK